MHLFGLWPNLKKMKTKIVDGSADTQSKSDYDDLKINKSFSKQKYAS